MYPLVYRFVALQCCSPLYPLPLYLVAPQLTHGSLFVLAVGFWDEGLNVLGVSRTVVLVPARTYFCQSRAVHRRRL